MHSIQAQDPHRPTGSHTAVGSCSEETAQPRALRAGLPYAFPQAVQADSASAALAAAAGSAPVLTACLPSPGFEHEAGMTCLWSGYP